MATSIIQSISKNKSTDKPEKNPAPAKLLSKKSRNKYGQTDVPKLVSPKAVAAGDNHTCALDANGVTCWGNNNEGQTKVPKLISPTAISAGVFHSCAVDSNGVKVRHTMHDVVMSGFAMMYTQDPSLLQFQRRLREDQGR